MAAANNFKPFGIGSGANVTAQADYEALAALISGFQSGKASSAQINKALRQGTVMASVLAQFIANTSGADVLDNGDTATLLTNLLAGLKANTAGGFLQTANNLSEIAAAGSIAKLSAVSNLGLGTGLTGVIGDARNAKMSVTAASATATFTADELIVGVALGGLQYRLGNFSKTIDMTGTGAGGIDVNPAFGAGFCAIYAIYNPTTGASALLGVNATSAAAPMIYGGSHMPAGYTASALVSVVPTNSASQIVTLYQAGRSISVNPTPVLSTSTAVASVTAVSLSAGVPKNALSVTLTGNTAVSGSTGIFINIYETAGSQGQHQSATTSTGLTTTIADIKLPTPQTIYATSGLRLPGLAKRYQFVHITFNQGKL